MKKNDLIKTENGIVVRCIVHYNFILVWEMNMQVTQDWSEI